MLGAQVVRQGAGAFQFVRRHRRRDRGECDGAVPESLACEREEQRRIDAAGVRDQRAPQAAQPRHHRFPLLREHSALA